MASASALAFEYVDYPESDGQPVAETQIHFNELVDLAKPLENHFEDHPDVWVAGNIFVYYQQGVPSAVVAPDVVVVRGIEKKNRKKYLLWEEGVAPCFVVELTSKSTKHEDAGPKKQKYAQLGVEELFLFDVLGEYLYPRFQGFRLMGGGYRPMRPLPDGSLRSRTLDLTLKPEGSQLRLIDAAGGVLLRMDEERKGRKEAERRAKEEANRRADAERRAQKEADRAQEEADRRAEAERKAAAAESRGLSAGNLRIATTLLELLAVRGVEVQDSVRSRILDCSDPDLLQDWLLRAADGSGPPFED